MPESFVFDPSQVGPQNHGKSTFLSSSKLGVFWPWLVGITHPRFARSMRRSCYLGPRPSFNCYDQRQPPVSERVPSG